MNSFRPTIFFMAIMVILSMYGCSNSNLTTSSNSTAQNHEPPKGSRPTVSFLTGKSGGLKLSDLTGGVDQKGTMPVNALLWRAALDTASVIPINDVDTFGGTIVTEWYQEPTVSDQRLKLTFFVIGLELRADAIQVRAYVQKRQGNNWIDSGQDEQLARRLEDLVLARARELRSKMIAESVK